MNPNPFSWTNFLILPTAIAATPSHTYTKTTDGLVCAGPAPSPLPAPPPLWHHLDVRVASASKRVARSTHFWHAYLLRFGFRVSRERLALPQQFSDAQQQMVNDCAELIKHFSCGIARCDSPRFNRNSQIAPSRWSTRPDRRIP